ncbi:MAG TPA: hypothetical protein VFO20_15875, partial [Propionibacteriaceae bacterium]|nr:hypothetical protein [Propionibacteriaceae bacterium]
LVRLLKLYDPARSLASASPIALWSISGSLLRKASKRCHLLGGIQLIQTTRFHGFYEFGEVGVELVEDHIQPRLLTACCWVPELHTLILFE